MEKLRELLEKFKAGEASAEDIESAVEERVGQATEKLKGENYKLREERRELRGQLDGAGDDDGKRKSGGVSSKAYYELEDKFEQLQGELDATKRELEKTQKARSRDVEQLSAERDNAAQQLDNYVIDQELGKAGQKLGIYPQLLDTFSSDVRRAGAQLERTDEGGVAVKVGDKPLEEFVEEWKGSEKAKFFIPASGSTHGAPSRNGGGSGGGGEEGEEFFDRESGKFNITEQAKIAREDPDRYKRLKEKHTKK